MIKVLQKFKNKGQAREQVRQYNQILQQNMFQQFNWQEISLGRSANHQSTPNERWGHRLLKVNGQLILFGGFGGLPQGQGRYLNDLWKFDLASASWQPWNTTGQYPQPRSNYTIHYNQVENQILVFGGGAYKVRYNELFALSLETNVWRKIVTQQNCQSPWERTYHTSEFYYPYLVMFGGEGVSYIDLNDTWAFDVRSNQWTKLHPKGNIPAQRRFAASALIDSDFYVIGGCNDNYSLLGDVHKLSLRPLLQGQLQNLAWQCLIHSNPLLQRWGHSCDVFNSKIYIFAGRVSSNQDNCDLIQYNPISGNLLKFGTTGKVPKPRRRHGSAIVGECLLVMGGYDRNYMKDFSFCKLQQKRVDKTELEMIKVKNSKQFNREIKKSQQKFGTFDFIEINNNQNKVKISTDLGRLSNNPFFKNLGKYHSSLSVQLPSFCSAQIFRCINLANTQKILLLNESSDINYYSKMAESFNYFCCFEQLKQLQNYLIKKLTQKNVVQLLELSVKCQLMSLNQAAALLYLKRGITQKPESIIPSKQPISRKSSSIVHNEAEQQIVITNQKITKSLDAAYKKYSFQIEQKILQQNSSGVRMKIKKFWRFIFSFGRSSQHDQLSREEADKQKCCGRALIEYLKAAWGY